MSKYSKFEAFMCSVVDVADKKAIEKYGECLNDLYKVKDGTIIKAVLALIDAGWGVFGFVCALLILGPIAFGSSLVALGSNPLGWIAIAALSAFGGIAAIKKLYRNKDLPLAIKETGKQYKPQFKELAKSEKRMEIDNLEVSAADYLLKLALKNN